MEKKEKTLNITNNSDIRILPNLDYSSLYSSIQKRYYYRADILKKDIRKQKIKNIFNLS